MENAAPVASPFAGVEPQDVLRLRTIDGAVVEGAYLTQAGMHFVHVRDTSPNGKVFGPFDVNTIVSVEVLKPHAEVSADRSERQRGQHVPGRLVRNREGYETRLDRLARAAAQEPEFRRRMQIERQFNDVADEIGLAKTKRNWLLAVAKWSLLSNQEPTKLDLSGGDMSIAEKFQRPRPQDFDPDPAVRRARPRVPDDIRADPRSTWNVLRTLRAHGFKARPSVFGEITHDSADLLVDFPGGREKGRFSLAGERNSDGVMRWRCVWSGNGSKADITRERRCRANPDFAQFTRIVRDGAMTPSADECCANETPDETPNRP